MTCRAGAAATSTWAARPLAEQGAAEEQGAEAQCTTTAKAKAAEALVCACSEFWRHHPRHPRDPPRRGRRGRLSQLDPKLSSRKCLHISDHQCPPPPPIHDLNLSLNLLFRTQQQRFSLPKPDLPGPPEKGLPSPNGMCSSGLNKQEYLRGPTRFPEGRTTRC